MRKSPSRRRIRLDLIVWRLIAILGAFYAGVLVGIHSTRSPHAHNNNDREFEQAVRTKVEAILRKRQQIDTENSHNLDYAQVRFGEATAHLAMAAVRVSKHDFVNTFDSGFPQDQGNPDPAASEVLVFYNGRKPLPNIRKEETMSATELPPKLTAIDATQNCQTLHVVSTKSALQQCIALVPQYESMHVQRWMRIEPGSKLTNELPLMPVGRGQQPNGVNQFEIPSQRAAQVNWKHLQTYLENVSSTREILKPILNKVAVDNTIGVMVCNRGQADLLTNFACASKTRGLSLDNSIVFCTDQDTYDIVSDLGMTAYYDTEVSYCDDCVSFDHQNASNITHTPRCCRSLARFLLRKQKSTATRYSSK